MPLTTHIQTNRRPRRRSRLTLSFLASILLCISWFLGSLVFIVQVHRDEHNLLPQIRHEWLLTTEHNKQSYFVVNDEEEPSFRLSSSFAYPLHPIVNASDKVPYYGDLEFGMHEEENTSRVIYHNYEEDKDRGDLREEKRKEEHYDNYYAFDDDTRRDPKNMYGRSSSDEDDQRKCRRVSWHRHTPVNCNTFHEFSVETMVTRGELSALDSGAYKQVFLVKNHGLVYKAHRIKRPYNYKDYEHNRMDSMVNERLYRVSNDNKIVPIYGFCALAQLGQAMPDGSLEDYAIPSWHHVVVEDADDVDPHNDLLPSLKLNLCLQMAQALAVMHGYPGGVIVHDDVQLSQFLVTPDKKHILLNDFNRAEPMLWNGDGYCKYRNGKGGGSWRAPEEYEDDWLDEKIDIYSLANNMYGILTGYQPYPELEESKEKIERVKQGRKPKLDPRWAEHSFAEGKLVEILDRMFAFEVTDRPDIFTIVKFLEEVTEQNEAHLMGDDSKALAFLKRKHREGGGERSSSKS